MFNIYGTPVKFEDGNTYYIKMAKIDTTHFLVVYYNNTTALGNSVIATVTDDTTITFGSVYQFLGTAPSYIGVSMLDSTHFVISFQGVSNYGYCIIGTISGSSISYGATYAFNAVETRYTAVAAIDSTHFVVAYDNFTDTKGTCVIGTVSNINQISYGSVYPFNNIVETWTSVAPLDSTHFVVAYHDFYNPDSRGFCVVGTIASINQISYGSLYEFLNPAYYPAVAAIDSTHFVVAFSGSSNYGSCVVGTVSSGTTIAYGTVYTFNAAFTNDIGISMFNSSSFTVCCTGANTYGYCVTGVIESIDQITFNDYKAFNSVETIYTSVATLNSTSYAVSYFQDGGPNGWSIAAKGSFQSPLASDTATITDSILLSIYSPVLFSNVSDTTTITDVSITENILKEISPSDTIAVTDSNTILIIPILIPNVSDTTAVTDSVVVLKYQQFTFAIFDITAVSGSSPLYETAYFLTVSDTATITDNVVPEEIDKELSSSEITTITDSVILKVSISINASDTIAITDSDFIWLIKSFPATKFYGQDY